MVRVESEETRGDERADRILARDQSKKQHRHADEQADPRNEARLNLFQAAA